MKDEDEFFLQCCLEELRDGETVTIEGSLAKHALQWLGEHGATKEELARVRLPGLKAQAPKKPARIDADKRAKPKTRLIHHPSGGKLAGPGMPLVDPELEDVDSGARTPLVSRPTRADYEALKSAIFAVESRLPSGDATRRSLYGLRIRVGEIAYAEQQAEERANAAALPEPEPATEKENG
jgi:hypothetical protein